MATGTLYELLTIANPDLDTRFQPTGPVTKNPKYVNLGGNELSIWHDFTFQNIEAAYSHLFSIGPIRSEAPFPFPRGSPAEIKGEANVDSIADMWNRLICRFPLKLGCQRLQTDLGLVPVEISMGLKKNSSQPLDGAKAMLPDWSIYLKNQPQTIAVWGDSKCSSKWNSDPSATDEGNYYWPFRQMATYCVNDDTRYGYIITPVELVVMRIIRDTNAIDGFRVQYQSIPWEEHGPQVLTVNLALWALAMMSVNEGHRPIVGQDWTLPVNVWWQDQNPQTGQVSFEHHLSGRIVQTLPAGAVPMPRPTTLPGQGTAQPQQTRRSARTRR